MKNQMKHAHKTHSFLWWSVVIISILFGIFLFLVSLGLFESYQISLGHFSPMFFIITLSLTIYMSYKKAGQRHINESMGPFLCSLLFGIGTQFIFFVLSPLVEWTSEIHLGSLVKMTVFFILPSLIAFMILRRMVSRETLGGDRDNSWFDWNFYLNWMAMMTNIMTVVSFAGLFLNTDNAILGVRGTIWAFYNIIADMISEHIS